MGAERAVPRALFGAPPNRVSMCAGKDRGCRRQHVDSLGNHRGTRQLAFQTSAKLPPEIEPGWARTAELLLFVMTISFGE